MPRRDGWKWLTRALIAAAGLSLGVATARADEGVSFTRQVLPVLSDNCYKCHGPDEAARKAHLRLDTRQGAFAVIKGQPVIAPGDIGRSELVRRITSTDPDVRMPPPKSGRTLTAAQIAGIRDWVAQGAKWETHWAFVPPVLPSIPEGFEANPIDALVRSRLATERLTQQPEAPKDILLRRVTLDLTGLPPTPAELDAFEADPSPNAYEKVVDRLLASPRYGEQMAVAWLDLARYADTHGYQADRYRAMWPYRDWVINQFNANQPYDQFVTWQLAGDLLPHATKEQRLATAFNRLHMQNEEGGIVEEEYRCAYVVDRVDTFGTAFLGLTFECSRCHDHKFDPITQKDFYSLFSFFQNIDESGQTAYFGDLMPVPTLLLTDDATDKKLDVLRRKIREKQQKIAELKAQSQDEFTRWIDSHGDKPPKMSGEVAAFDFDSITKNEITNGVDAKKSGKAVESPRLIDAPSGHAALLSGENGFTFPGVGNFNRAQSFSLAIDIKPSIVSPRMVILHHSKAPIDAGSRGYELLLEDGHVAFGLHHMWPGNSLKVRTRDAIPVDAWTKIVTTYDGSSRATGAHIYIDGKPADVEVIRDGLYKDITYNDGEPDLAIGYRFRDNGFKEGAVTNLRVFDRALTAVEIAGTWDVDRHLLADHFFATEYKPAIESRAMLQSLRAEENQITNPVPEVMVMQELPTPKPAYVLKRGAYDAHGDPVTAASPASLPPMKADLPRNRLGLAKWLFDDANPLAARVAVNHLWQQMFGKGIVESSDNFGVQGSPPSDQKLLDWLAVDFRSHGWDVKRELKQIAMSATYRQSSVAPPEQMADDPENRKLARGPSRRLTAEMIRDQALADAGILVEKLGGPSVKPYQPNGVWDVAMGKPTYDQGHGYDLHRRSMYTFWKRSVAPPAMLAFDAPDRNYCVARRQSTSTPLQALALLNDVQITESAKLIAQRAMHEGGSTSESRSVWIFRLSIDRAPTAGEQKILGTLLDEQHEVFAADPKAAEKLLASGEAKVDPALDSVDLASLTVLAEAMLNHDGAIMRR